MHVVSIHDCFEETNLCSAVLMRDDEESSVFECYSLTLNMMCECAQETSHWQWS